MNSLFTALMIHALSFCDTTNNSKNQILFEMMNPFNYASYNFGGEAAFQRKFGRLSGLRISFSGSYSDYDSYDTITYTEIDSPYTRIFNNETRQENYILLVSYIRDIIIGKKGKLYAGAGIFGEYEVNKIYDNDEESEYNMNQYMGLNVRIGAQWLINENLSLDVAFPVTFSCLLDSKRRYHDWYNLRKGEKDGFEASSERCIIGLAFNF